MKKELRKFSFKSLRRANDKDLNTFQKVLLLTVDWLCSGRKITASFGCVTERWKGQGGARRQRVCLNMCTINENIFSLLISTQLVAFWCNDFYTALYFVNQRNYKTLAMQAHALTRTRYFYSLNVIISHPLGHKEWLGYHSLCAIASRSSPLIPACVCNGHPSSQLCCGNCTVRSHYNYSNMSLMQ
jgi:hypothetical protein